MATAGSNTTVEQTMKASMDLEMKGGVKSTAVGKSSPDGKSAGGKK